MRGTRSLGFTLDAVRGRRADPAGALRGHREPDDASRRRTCCGRRSGLGLASDAVGRARAFVRAEARRAPGTVPPGALRLAETVAELGTMRATVHGGRADFERHQDDPDALAGLGFAIRMNNLKAIGVAHGARDRGARARRLRGQRLPVRLAVLGRAASSRCAQRRAHDQQRSRPLGERRHAAACTRKTEVSSTDRGRVGARNVAFRDELLRHGLLIATGVPGVYGRSGDFEDTVEARGPLVDCRSARTTAPEVMRFPPILNRAHFERSGYLKSFPHLAGYDSQLRWQRAGASRAAPGRWRGRRLERGAPACRVVLTPAACYPVYPVLAGTLPAGGRLVDVMSYCFRHEPSDDAGRMQMFRMHEHVRAADPEYGHGVAGRVDAPRRAFADGARPRRAARKWRQIRSSAAADKLLASASATSASSSRSWRQSASDERPTAIISLNYHQDHFGSLFGITHCRRRRSRTPRASGSAWSGSRWRSIGGTASTAQRWPSRVREALGL